MQYLIDGYNLLFKCSWARQAPSLEEARTSLIKELDYHGAILNVPIIIVFDAPLQSDDLKRGHFHSLEIIFTAKGQTADDYIHDYVACNSQKIVVITSDKTVARKVKALGAHAETAHDFLQHLRKKSQNRLAKAKKIAPVRKCIETPAKTQMPDVTLTESDPLPALSNLAAWQQIFEKRFKELS